MAQRFLMGLDVGGGTVRCLLVDVDSGRVVATSRPWIHATVPDTGGFGFDLSTDTCWRLLSDASREALSIAGAAAGDVAAVSTTGMRHATVILDRAGDVSFATPTRDARAHTEGIAMAAERGDAVYRQTGHWPAPLFAASRLKWLAAHEPEVLAGASAVLGVSDWLGYQLSGERAVEASVASETMLCRVDSRRWATDLIASLGLPANVFPKVVSAGDRLGSLTPSAAEALGVAPGIPVIAGGGDTQCGLIGAGAVDAGNLGVVAGTTMPIQLTLGTPVIDGAKRLWTNHHAAPGLWVLESNGGATGEMLAWIANVLYPGDPRAVAMLAAEACESVPGAAGLTSTLGTDVFNASEMSLPIGHLTVSHMMAASDPERRRHVARSILEGMAYGIRANVAQLLEVGARGSSDRPPTYLAGGMSRSVLFCQIASDLLDSEVRVASTPEASALGAAICAGVGARVFTDVREGARALARTTTYSPSDDAARYEELYESWTDLRNARTESDALAAELAFQAISTPDVDGDSATTGAAASFRPRIMVTAAMDDEALDALRELGDVKYASFREELELLVGDDLVEALKGYHVFVTEVDIVDAEVLAELPELRVVVTCRGDPVNLDIPACTAHGIPVLSTPGRNADAVADLAVGYMLMLSRKLVDANAFLREPGGEAGDMGRMGMAFEQLQGRELWRKTIGIVGLGAVGRGVARRLAPFGVRLLAYDPFQSEEKITLAGAEPASLEQLLRDSDIVTLHAAVGDDDRALIGAEELASMKPGALLINTARAALVDEAALVQSLRSGHLGGAGVDVFSVEPPPSDHPLLAMNNVVATPHVGGNTVEVSTHQGAIVAADLRRLLSGGRPSNVLNPDAMDGFAWAAAREMPTEELLEQLRSEPPPAVTDLDAQHSTPSVATPAPTAATVAPAEIEEPPKPGFFRRLFGSKKPKQPTVVVVPTAHAAKSNGKSKSNGVAVGGAVDTTVARARMQQVLTHFLPRMAADDNFTTFAQKKDITVSYQIPDVDLGFYMQFAGGAVATGMGDPPAAPQVTLKMKADILDKLFTGSASGARLAMSGKLSFSGDTLKAMSMRRLQKHMNRLYGESRDEIGGMDEALAASSSPAVETAAASGGNPAAAVALVGDERDEMIPILDELYAAGVITSSGGNISVRVEGEPGHVWVTPNQIPKGELRAEHMVRVDMDGNPVGETERSPTSERMIHCGILRQNPEVNAVIHSHAPKATTLALSGLPFLPISTEAAFIGDIPVVPFIMPGTEELAEKVAEAIGTGCAVFMQNHGLVVAGGDLRHAATITHVIEQTADKLLTLHALGVEPPVLPDDLVASLRELGEMLG